MEFCNCSMFCYALCYDHSGFAIILMGKRGLVDLLSLSSWCLVIVVCLFLAVPWVCLQLVIVVFTDHTHLLFTFFLVFFYEREIHDALSIDEQADIIDAFNTTSRYLDDILNINNIYFDSMVRKYTFQSLNLMWQILLILKPRFWTCICSFLMILFLPKFMLNMTILILKVSISHFRW